MKPLMKNDRSLNYTGLNLIRILIGSYLVAISLGLIEGFDQGALLRPLLPGMLADLAGTVVLFGLAACFMAGVHLRIFALALALFVLVSSLLALLPQFSAQAASFLWRDLVLVCAILLSYAPLRRRELRHAALIPRYREGLARRRRRGAVRPRRVKVKSVEAAQRRPNSADVAQALRPPIAPTNPIRRPEELSDSRHQVAASIGAAADCDDIDNIFVSG